MDFNIFCFSNRQTEQKVSLHNHNQNIAHDFNRGDLL